MPCVGERICPKLRVFAISLTRSSRAQIERMISTVRSVEQLSMKISSNEQPVLSISAITALQIGSAFSSSLRQGITIEISGQDVFLSIAILLLAGGFSRE